MFIETGSSARKEITFDGYRQCFGSMNKAMADIRDWQNRGNVYITVYKYTQTENNGRVKPLYESAIVDKMFFDFDCMKKDNGKEYYDYAVHEGVMHLDDYLEKHDYERKYFLSGGGFHAFVSCNGGWQNLTKAMLSLDSDLGLHADTATFGDLARMRRVPGTLNWGRNVYCIPVQREELSLPMSKLWMLASTPRKGVFVYGKKALNIDVYEGVKVESKRFIITRPIREILGSASMQEVVERNGMIEDDICSAIKAAKGTGIFFHKNRLLLIKYLRSVVGLNYEDCIVFLQSFLSSEEFKHCMGEHQVEMVYEKDRSFHPEFWRMTGLCPDGCRRCEDISLVRNGGKINH